MPWLYCGMGLTIIMILSKSIDLTVLFEDYTSMMPK